MLACETQRMRSGIERPQQRLGRLAVGDEVVVHEEEVPARLGLDLRHHLGDRPAGSVWCSKKRPIAQNSQW